MKDIDINRLLNPATVAVVGASETEGKAGMIIMKNLLRSKARLYPVNPSYETILHIPAASSIKDLPQGLDLAIITLNAKMSVAAAREAAEAGTAFIIIVAGGFGETGSSGKAYEQELKDIAKQTGSRILGPNSLGVFVPDSKLDTIFVEHGDEALADGGGIAFISQSGSVGVESLGLASNTGYGMRAFIGTGNKTDLSELDFMDWFARDPSTACLALYLESIEGGREFLDKAAKISSDKPVVVLKAGRTEAGAAAAGSHTGRLAGSDAVTGGAFRQSGIQRAWDDEELCDASKVLSMLKPADGNRVAVVTPAGGFGVMCTDYIDTAGTRADLKMAELSAGTVRRIKESTFEFASCANPVDLTASADDDMFIDTIEALLADDGVDIVICIALFAAPTITGKLVPRLSETIRNASKPVIVFTEYGPFTDRYLLDFYRNGIAGFPSIGRAVRAARFLVERGNLLKERKNCEAGPACSKDVPESEIYLSWLESLRTAGKPDEFEVKGLLRDFGLFTPAEKRIPPEHPVSVPDDLRFPVVLKVCSPDILHKTEHGGVVLNVGREDFESKAEGLREIFPGEPLLVSEMISYEGSEMIVGALSDSSFGPAVMAGAGGILTELYRDTAFRLAPCSPETASAMLGELQIAPLFSAYRGSSMDKNKLAETISCFSELAAVVCGRGGQIDINPLVWDGENWLVLDAKIVTK